MVRRIIFQTRLSTEEKKNLEAYARSKEVSMSEIIQDYWKRLKVPDEKEVKVT